MKDGGRKTIKHPMSIYRCCVHDCIKKFAKFPSVKNKAHCKRLPIYSDLLPSYAARHDEVSALPARHPGVVSQSCHAPWLSDTSD